jgi:hypothetical protein
MIRYLGVFTVGGLFPTMVGFVLGVIPRIRAQLAGALRLSGQIEVTLPTVEARLQAAVRMAAQLQAQLALTPPGVRFNAVANAELAAKLAAQLALVAGLEAALGSAGVEAFSYSGSRSAMANEVSGAIGEHIGADHVDALIFATQYPATFQAMGRVFVA